MGRYLEAPPGFECTYRDHCPHLSMSTTWARTLIADLEKDPYRLAAIEDAYQAEIKALEAENRALRQEVEELKARLQARHTARFKPARTHRKRPPRASAGPAASTAASMSLPPTAARKP